MMHEPAAENHRQRLGFSRLLGSMGPHSPAIEMQVADVILERNGFP
jgi:hypothetical protein